MEEILLTIVIPVYNAETNLKKCLDSIMPQLKKNYEVLLINDGSGDGSLDILYQYEACAKDIIRVIDKPNEGVAKTRNLAISLAKGRYITFLDNDDFIEAAYFETYLDAAAQGEYDLVLGGYRRVSDKEVKFTVSPVDSAWYPFTVTAPWAKLYRTEFLKEHKVEFLPYPLGEDIYFSLQLYARKPRIRILPYIGYNWYFNEESVSNTIQRGFRSEIDILKLADKLYEVGDNENTLFLYYYVRFLVWYLLFSGRNASPEEFSLEYVKIRQWLKKNNIKYKFPLFSKELQGERFSVKVEINVFIWMSKLHLTRLFALVFCKGK